MNSKRQASKSKRRGMTLLELVIASSMLAMVLTAVGVVLRTGRQAWEAHAADYTRIESAHATIRHMVRRVRQATSVETITPETDNSGQLSLKMPDASIEVWDHDSATNTIMYGVTNPTGVLSTDIVGLRLTGYEADGLTVTTVPNLVRAIRVDVTIQLPVQSGGSRVISSWAWIRSW